ncbi:hypothetical protein fsci_19060 [Francisella sciaenopsi]|uniref:Spore coat protein n=1 Tax=Francisella sciaenopsi TaxID=3055034 RepID=A0ABQ6PIL0_9GAMM
MVDYLCIIQARLNSSRLPAKIMLDLGGKTLVERVFETVSKSKKIEHVVVATSNDITDDIVGKKLSSVGIEVFRGSLTNVLNRFYILAKKYKAKNIVRVTADNPLMDANLIDELIAIYEENECDYSMFSGAVYGLSAEVFSFAALEEAEKNARNDFDREHVTPYIKEKGNIYIEPIEKKYHNPDLRATIDTLDDYISMQKFYMYCKELDKESNIDNFMQFHQI